MPTSPHGQALARLVVQPGEFCQNSSFRCSAGGGLVHREGSQLAVTVGEVDELLLLMVSAIGLDHEFRIFHPTPRDLPALSVETLGRDQAGSLKLSRKVPTSALLSLQKMVDTGAAPVVSEQVEMSLFSCKVPL